ncbi:MAG: hypothetical protein M3N54_12530 [Acidobacteriota bacterium]|nr:hypothetical protein [Acidobacteriota bacterium]
MATAIVPIIAQLIPLMPQVIDLIASLVHHKAQAAEVTHGPGTGPVKFTDVFVGTMKELVAAHVAGQIDAVPSDDQLRVVIQAVVKTMKLSSLLSGAPPIAPNGIQIAAGQTLTISVAP